MNFYITKRSNLLDCDGSALHDSLEILEEFDDLNSCKKKFNLILKQIDCENVIRKSQTKNQYNHGLKTLISEYRKIEIFKFVNAIINTKPIIIDSSLIIPNDIIIIPGIMCTESKFFINCAGFLSKKKSYFS